MSVGAEAVGFGFWWCRRNRICERRMEEYDPKEVPGVIREAGCIEI